MANIFPMWHLKKKKIIFSPKSIIFSPKISEIILPQSDPLSPSCQSPSLSSSAHPLSPPALTLSPLTSSSTTSVYQSLDLPLVISLPQSPSLSSSVHPLSSSEFFGHWRSYPSVTPCLSHSGTTGSIHYLSQSNEASVSLSVRRSSCLSLSPPPTVSSPSLSSTFKI
jgi:hypothetical protein